MTEWLERHRLQHYATRVTRIAGGYAHTPFIVRQTFILAEPCLVFGACSNVVPSDLQYLTDENIGELGSVMTHVEQMRLQTALQALSGAHPSRWLRFYLTTGLTEDDRAAELAVDGTE